MGVNRFVVTASDRAKVLSDVVVFNQSEIEYELKVHIDADKFNQLALLEISEGKSGKTIDINRDVTIHKHHPWIDINKRALDLDPGQHIYKLEFLDIKIDETCEMFFAYIIQQDNPEKPYIYMDEARKYHDS